MCLFSPPVLLHCLVCVYLPECAPCIVSKATRGHAKMMVVVVLTVTGAVPCQAYCRALAPLVFIDPDGMIPAQQWRHLSVNTRPGPRRCLFRSLRQEVECVCSKGWGRGRGRRVRVGVGDENLHKRFTLQPGIMISYTAMAICMWCGTQSQVCPVYWKNK